MFSERIAAIAADRVSGASAILARAIDILHDARAANADLLGVARALVRAQPCMAPVWNAALAALASRDDPRHFDAFAERLAVAPGALTRAALGLFDGAPDRAARRPGDALHIVTISCSGTVTAVVKALGATRRVHVACGEGRPAMEGRALATDLASAGITVTFMTDAALGQALPDADAVLVGADAITADHFLNKAGTRMLATTAAADGIPVYVVASRDKFTCAAVASRLADREAPLGEVWADAPAGVRVRNLYFEPTRLDVVTGFITDAGILDALRVRETCAALDRDIPERLVAALER